jgi:hypothetical protein
MVNFILNLLGATLCAVITSITRIELNRKAILKEIAHGEWVAMSPRIIAGGSKWQVTAQNWGESGRMRSPGCSLSATLMRPPAPQESEPGLFGDGCGTRNSKPPTERQSARRTGSHSRAYSKPQMQQSR